MIPTNIVRDYWPTTKWRISSPEQQGMNSAFIKRLGPFLNEIQTRPMLHTVLVIRHGYIVYEWYGKSFQPESYQICNSMTKSVISTLIGIALKQGYLQSLDQRWEAFFPDYFTAETDPRKKQITLRHLLTMTSGLNPDVLAYPGRFGDQSTDWVRYAVEKHVLASPDQLFMYGSLGSHLLSIILTKVSCMSTLEFARTFLFAPLGIAADEQEGFAWATDPMGYYIGGAGLQLKAQDMAKIGYLYLNNGQWNGEQIISPAYTSEATQEHSRGGSPESTSYGYHWWVTHEEGQHSFFAAGFGGQFTWVFPALDVVIVIFAPDAFAVGEYHRKFIASQFVLPAITE